jgi:hypothetical protein
MGNRANQNVCMDNWSNKGHFQNLLELEDDASAGNRTRWRYGPFLTTRYNLPGPKDYLELPRVPNKVTGAPLDGGRVVSLDVAWPRIWLTFASIQTSLLTGILPGKPLALASLAWNSPRLIRHKGKRSHRISPSIGPQPRTTTPSF